MFIKPFVVLASRISTLRDRGAVAGEYAVLLALIAVALVAIIGTFTGGIIAAFQAAIDVLPTGAPATP